MINWIVRYAKIIDQNRDLFDASNSILEVGSGNIGIARYLKRRVVGLEPEFSGPVDEWLEPVQGDIFAIPYPDASFDIVLCVDVLEHLTAASRPRAIAELIRCARGKVIIACPCGRSADDGDRQLGGFFNRSSIAIPSWLQEHLDNGLPSVGNILRVLSETGLLFEVTGNETITQHYSGIFLDYFFPLAQQLNNILLSKTALMAPVTGAEWDYYYSFLFTIHIGTASRPRPELDYGASGSRSGPTTEIYAVYHKPYPLEHLGRMTPIFAGNAAQSAGAGQLTDILRDGQRLSNARWSELSAIYKIWKDGPRSDIVGFCHYRRLFDFASFGATNRETKIQEKDLPNHTASYFDQTMFNSLQGNALIVALPLESDLTIWDDYGRWHNLQDYCRIVNIIARKYPQLIPFMVEQHETNALFGTNMFVMSWLFFDELCRMWFDVLLEFEKEVPPNRGNSYQNRDISFLSERVFDAWVRYKKFLGTEIIQVPIFFVE